LKKILILTAGFGEGHNAAARGLRDALQGTASRETEVEMRDLFAETYGILNNWARKSYLEWINRAPHLWSRFYRWLDRKKTFAGDFRALYAVRNSLVHLLAEVQPDVVVSVFPAYPHLLDEIRGDADAYRRVVVVTDSITVNAIWYRCRADYFLVPNEESAKVLRDAGVAAEIIRAFGFPVSPRLADGGRASKPSEESGRHVLFMINAAKASAIELARRLAELREIKLTVTVGRDVRLRSAIEQIRRPRNRDFEIIGWCNDLPRLLQSSHLLISKAGGATVQETIAAGCPMIINQVVPGQEEGNARLIAQSGSGVIAITPESVIAEVQRIFADNARVWSEMASNIRRISRPRASLEIARFLLSL
jgi:processive 1,2-diacylglycerol beta-glucosyltransferase